LRRCWCASRRSRPRRAPARVKMSPLWNRREIALRFVSRTARSRDW
jgi:hypothetical protein